MTVLYVPYSLDSGNPERHLVRDWYFIAEQPAPAPHLARPEGHLVKSLAVNPLVEELAFQAYVRLTLTGHF